MRIWKTNRSKLWLKLVDIIFIIWTFFTQKTIDFGNIFCTKFLLFCVWQETSQDVSLAQAFLAPETQEIPVHETRSSTRVVFVLFLIQILNVKYGTSRLVYSESKIDWIQFMNCAELNWQSFSELVSWIEFISFLLRKVIN